MSDNIAAQNEQVADVGLAQRIFGVFFSPSQTFQAVRQKPNWLQPTIIVLVLSLGMALLLKPVILEERINVAVEKMEEGGADQAQIDTAIERIQNVMNIMIWVGPVVFTFLMLVIGAGIWMFVSNTILGGQAQFGQLMAVNAYRMFIVMLGSLIKLPIMLSQKTLNVHFSVAAFLPDASKDTLMYKLLAQLEVFNIWSIALLCIGIAIVGNHTTRKVVPWVVGLYVLWYVGSSSLGSIFG